MRPISDPRHVAMFDRIDVDVVDVTGEIIFITNGVLPVTPLPNTAFALSEIRSPAGTRRENPVLINRQRVAKSASPSGIVQTA